MFYLRLFEGGVREMKLDFWKIVWSSFLKAHGSVLAVVSLSVSFITWIFKPDLNVPVVIFLPIVLVIILVLTTAITTVFQIRDISWKLPEVKFCKRCGNNLILLLEKSVLFSYGIIVSIYFIHEGEFEQLIGVGQVTNVQEDGKIQITIRSAFDEHLEIFDRLSQNNGETLKKIIAKPTVPWDYILNLGGDCYE